MLTETTPFAADHPKAAQRIALESALAQAAQAQDARAQGLRSIVIRAGDFLGDAGSWMERAMGTRLAQGRFTQMGAADVPHAWAYLPHLARVFVRVAEQRVRLDPHAVLHQAGITLNGSQMQAGFEAVLGRRLKPAARPWWLMRLPAPVAAMPRALMEMRHQRQRPHRQDEQRLNVLLAGRVPHTALHDVLREALASLPGAGLPVSRAAAAPAWLKT